MQSVSDQNEIFVTTPMRRTTSEDDSLVPVEEELEKEPLPQPPEAKPLRAPRPQRTRTPERIHSLD